MSFHKATSEWPESFQDDEVKKFLEAYYETSNNPDAHDEYAEFFTEDATFVIGYQRATGRSDVRALREKVWSQIPERDHRAVRIFPFDNSGKELMVYGTVDYNHHDDTQKGSEWAARVILAREGGKVKMALCHVFLDSADQK